jgi:hypothetical protein
VRPRYRDGIAEGKELATRISRERPVAAKSAKVRFMAKSFAASDYAKGRDCEFEQ